MILQCGRNIKNPKNIDFIPINPLLVAQIFREQSQKYGLAVIKLLLIIMGKKNYATPPLREGNNKVYGTKRCFRDLSQTSAGPKKAHGED